MTVLLVVVGVLCSATAQVLLKLSARWGLWTLPWVLSNGGAGLSYLVSFLLYSLILRKSELSRMGPLMTNAVSLLVAGAGILLFGETLSLRKVAGIALGAVALVLLAG